jgi:hypothetical protein
MEREMKVNTTSAEEDAVHALDDAPRSEAHPQFQRTKEAVRAWLRQRRQAHEAPPSIAQIRAELGWSAPPATPARQPKH